MLTVIKWLFILLVTVVLAGLAVVNNHLISIQFFPLPYELETPAYLLIVLLFFIGFFFAWLLGRIHLIACRHALHQVERRRDALQEEVTRLRHQPGLPAEKP